MQRRKNDIYQSVPIESHPFAVIAAVRLKMKRNFTSTYIIVLKVMTVLPYLLLAWLFKLW